MTETLVNIEDTAGLWERSLIAWPDGRLDTTTLVAWLQGPSLFADLRQPTDLCDFRDVACLNDLNEKHVTALARQEGFAGRLTRAADAFEWRRAIDYQCTTDAADAGFLAFSEGILIERGRDVPYIEHWHRTGTHLSPHFAMSLTDGDGRAGYLVRVGDIFMYARDRERPLPHRGSLSELVGNGPIEEARRLVDCEISLGSVRGASWNIGRSSLPYRRRSDLAPVFSADRETVATSDIDDDGTPIIRNWTVTEFEVNRRESRYQSLTRSF